jgi:outer membrane protein assembly factor BamB
MSARTLQRRSAVTVVAIAMVGFLVTTGSMGTAVAGLAVTGTGDWPMYGDGPAHNNLNRAERTLSTSTVARLKMLHVHPNWAAFDVPTPLVVGSTGYGQTFRMCGVTCLAAYVTAFQLPAGTNIWRQRVEIPANTGACQCVPAISNDVLYVGGDNAMYAFNASNGNLLWKTAVGPSHTSPGVEFNPTTVAGSAVYASTSFGKTVYAFNAKTGAILWSVVPPGCCPIGPVSVANGLAYVATDDHLIAYNAATGALVFTSATTVVGSTVAVSNGVAFVQDQDFLDAFNARTGHLLWSSPHMPSPPSLAPAVDGSTVVVGTPRFLIAFAASDGHRLWTVDGGSNRTDYFPPAIANGVVYAGSVGKGLQAVNEATGAVLFTSTPPGGFAPCLIPIVSHGAVWASCDVPGTGMVEFGL